MDEPGRLIPAGAVPLGLAGKELAAEVEGQIEPGAQPLGNHLRLAAIRVHAADESAECPALCRPPAEEEGFGKGCAGPATKEEPFAVGADGHAANARVAIAREKVQRGAPVVLAVAVRVLQPVDPAAVPRGHHVEAAKRRKHPPRFALRERDFQRLDRPGVSLEHPEDPARLITTKQEPLRIHGKRRPSPALGFCRNRKPLQHESLGQLRGGLGPRGTDAADPGDVFRGLRVVLLRREEGTVRRRQPQANEENPSQARFHGRLNSAARISLREGR